MKKKILLIIVAAIVLHYNSKAQIQIDAEIRPRFEFRNGYKTLRDSTTTPSYHTSQRSRINFKYKDDKINSLVSFQDVRIWGDEKAKNDIASSMLHEAWAEFLISKKFSVKAGRQSIRYDNKRLIGPSNWNQIGLKHDALLLKYKDTNLEIDLGSAFNQTQANNFGTDYTALSSDNYKTLNFLWISKKINKITLSSLSIADAYQKTGTTSTLYMRGTIGGIIKYENDNLSFILRVFDQTGKNKTGQDINAYYFNTDIKYKINDKTNIAVGIEYMSGNDAVDSTNTVDNSFDILYGAKHNPNGKIDYFSTPATTTNAGLNNTYLKFDYKLNKKTTVFTDVHYFMLQNNYIYNNKVIDKYLGTEIDIYAIIKLSDISSLMLGYSAMFANESTEIIKGTGDSDKIGHWAFLMLTVKPVFFKKDK